MQTYPFPNMFLQFIHVYNFIILILAALDTLSFTQFSRHTYSRHLWRCIGGKKYADSNRRRALQIWHTLTTSQSEGTWNHTQKSQNDAQFRTHFGRNVHCLHQCVSQAYLNIVSHSPAPKGFMNPPTFQQWLEFHPPQVTIKCSKIRPKSKSSMCWDLMSHRKCMRRFTLK